MHRVASVLVVHDARMVAERAPFYKRRNRQKRAGALTPVTALSLNSTS
jgi:hypothetical protein